MNRKQNKKRSMSLSASMLLVVVALAGACFAKNKCSTDDQVSATAIAAEDPLQKAEVSSTGQDTSAVKQGENACAELCIPRYECSRGGQVVQHVGYTLSYDSDFKTPQWVGWTITTEKAQGTVPRCDKFGPDPEVRGAQAYDSDYKGSGYDRGHIAPAGDMKWSEEAMRESFYLTNVCPQNRNLNRGDWKELEELEREWALQYGSVSITAGPIYNSKQPQRIGANHVAVPDGFFKVLLVGYPNNPKAYGFLYKNEAGSRPMKSYQLSVDEVERITGMDFFSALPDDVENRIEAEMPAL